MKVRAINRLLLSGVLIFCISETAQPSLPEPSIPSYSASSITPNAFTPEFIDRLQSLDKPVSREGAGLLIIQAPGERYRLKFRLIARGPEAMRLEIFDPFGRPILYLFSFQGRVRLFSITQNKEIPFNLSSIEPWASFPQIPPQELLKLFWGRVPLFPKEMAQGSVKSEKGNKEFKIELRNSILQEIWGTTDPFAVTRARITRSSHEGEIEILFSEFSEAAGNRIPMRCEIRDGKGEYIITLRYETVVLRRDISDEVFSFPEQNELSNQPPTGN